MAHNLATTNGKAAMFYFGEAPWHKLGTKLENPATAAEAIEAAGLELQRRTRSPVHPGRQSKSPGVKASSVATPTRSSARSARATRRSRTPRRSSSSIPWLPTMAFATTRLVPSAKARRFGCWPSSPATSG